MKKNTGILFAGVFLIFSCLLGWNVAPGQAISFPWWNSDPPEFGELWNSTMKKLDHALDLLDKHDDLPDKKMMHRDKEENNEEINEILEGLVVLLSDTDTARLRRKAQELQEYIVEKQEDIAEIEENLLTAPEEGSLFRKSREDWKEKIAELQEDVDEAQQALGEARQAMVEAIRQSGVAITDEDVKGLLVSVTGDDILGMYGVYQNVRRFSDSMGDLLKKESASPSIAKRYYGIYALLIRVCIVMNENFIEKIGGGYLPTLEDLEKQALDLRKTAREELRKGGLSTVQQQTLESNVRSNTLTLTVVLQYRNYLLTQRRDAEKALYNFNRDYAVALNSYKTVALSSTLLDMIRTNQKEFEALTSLRLPEMLLFDNEAMWQEFEQISRTLKK